MTSAQLRKEMSKPKGQKRAAGINAKQIVVDGITFPSRKEARRWQELNLLQTAGQISNLDRQVPIELEGRDGPILTPTGRAMTYRADFTYKENGRKIVEDAKGYRSDIYLLKKAILKAMGIFIRET